MGHQNNTILVTGGAGFIGSNFVLEWVASGKGTVINFDKLTYAGNMQNLSSLEENTRHIFICGDICDGELVGSLLEKYKPDAIVHFAAESHVDRSIHGPEDFIRTNINGTFTLLEEARAYWQSLSGNKKQEFRFLHVSTDEVYGSLERNEPPFTESSVYKPNSPYSASKAASDHLVRSYFHTYGLPVLTTNCSNNYGPYQFPEKLIPLVIMNALNGRPLPIYGDGMNIRDWLYVTDHCNGICTVLEKGIPGEVYNIGGWNEKTNLDVVNEICRILDELKPNPVIGSYASLINFVEDRAGHDRRYAIDASKIDRQLGWKPKEVFESAIKKTVQWYLDNQDWVDNVTSGEYMNWVEKNYSEREML